MRITRKLSVLMMTILMCFARLSLADSKMETKGTGEVNYRQGPDISSGAIIVKGSIGKVRAKQTDNLLRPQVISGTFAILFLITGFLYYNHFRRSSKTVSALRISLIEQAFCLEQIKEEKEWLTKEIHHRVKNTLQIVMSLLNTQLAYLKNGEAVEAIRNSQHRMYAIALIHQKLYQSESLSAIDMSAYIPELLEYLKDAIDTGERITYKIALVPLSLDVSRALPLGLIINEAVSNALKFAFPKDTKGEIRLELKTYDEIHYTFHISDNGVGLIKDFPLKPENSFGRTLMAGLANQIGGTYQLEDAGGVSIHIGFNKTE